MPSFDGGGLEVIISVSWLPAWGEARKHPLDFSDEKRLGTALEGCSVLQLGFDRLSQKDV